MPVGGTRSTFGSQTSSRRSSAPSYGFGSGTREVASKVFVSQEHAKLETGKGVPGPATYTLTASVAKQESSTKASAPNYGFGTGERWMKPSKDTAPGPGQYDMTGGVGPQTSSARTSAPKYGFGSATREHVEKVYIEEEFNKADFGRNSPGPCAPYQTTTAIGKQVLSGKAGQPTWVIGNAERFSMDHVKRSAGAPGPGAYALPAAVGPQVASTKPSTPRFGFGTSNREHQEKVYISPEHEKSSAGRIAPGPGQYPIGNMTGAKISSSQAKTAAAFGFGTATRFAVAGKSSGPGPGEYVI